MNEVQSYRKIKSGLCSVTTRLKITHFEQKNQSALNIGPTQRTLRNYVSKCVKRVQNHYFWFRPLTHFEKINIQEKTFDPLFFQQRKFLNAFPSLTESYGSFLVGNGK